MALPNCQITISPDGNAHIEGLEKTNQCYKLSELGKKAGRVTSDTTKDHPPITQHVNRK